MSDYIGNYLTSRLIMLEEQIKAAEAVLDEKKLPRRLAPWNTLTLAQRIVLAIGDSLPDPHHDEPSDGERY